MSKGTWIACEKVSQISSKFYNTPIIWDPLRKESHPVGNRRLKMYISTSVLLLILLVHTVVLIFKNVTSPIRNPDFTPMVGIMATLFIGGFSTSLILCGTMLAYRDDISNEFKQIQLLYTKMQKKGKGKIFKF